jgi:fructoselysine 6-kinase
VTPTLVAVGDNCLDVYLTHDLLAVGGNALNVAVQWRRNGWPARYVGAVGDDPEGGIVRDEISAAGLEADDVECRPGQTGVTLMSHEFGDRRFLLEDLGVGDRYEPSERRYREVRDADWVHLGTHSSAGLVRRLVADGVRFSVDISTDHVTVPVAGVPLVFASGPDASDEPVEPLMRSLLAAGAQRVVVTCGRRGAFFSDGDATIHQPATPVRVIDTCGAGDSFIATFLTTYCCERNEPSVALLRAAAAAGETCTHMGGFPQRSRAVPSWLLDKYSEHIAPVPNPEGH